MPTEKDIAALDAVLSFRGKSSSFRERIAAIQDALSGLPLLKASAATESFGATADLLRGALLVKRMSAQIDVVLHAVGILRAIPHILAPDERIISLSLGAGNTGQAFDMSTDRQVAEFKFIHWKGGAESVRQNTLLIDVFHLAAADTTKRRVLYLTGAEIPLKFLRNSRRATRECLAQRRGEPTRFDAIYGSQHPFVKDYWAAVSDRIEVVDLLELVPGLSDLDLDE